MKASGCRFRLPESGLDSRLKLKGDTRNKQFAELILTVAKLRRSPTHFRLNQRSHLIRQGLAVLEQIPNHPSGW